jgi:hypothetical protein
MATAILIEFPKGTQRQYDEVIDALGLKDPNNLPRGLISHVAGPTESGWEVVDVWESRADFDRFLAQRLGPAVREAGLPAPRPIEFPVYNSMGQISIAGTRRARPRRRAA